MKRTCILLILIYLLGLSRVYAQDPYYKVVNGIPYLPVLSSTDAVTSPLPGAMVFSISDGTIMFYNGSVWGDMCNLGIPVATNAKAYFRVVKGIPCLAIMPSPDETAPAGSICFPSKSNTPRISNGSGWYHIGTREMSSISTVTGTRMGGAGTMLGIPVLADNPGNVSAGAFYFNSGLKSLTVYNGSAWLTLNSCDCPPQAGGVYAESGDPTFSSSPVTFFGTYSYYDKEGNSEGTAACEWFMSDDENGTNAVPMGTGATLSYSISNEDNGKYMYLVLTPKSGSGTLIGDPVQSNFVKIMNCPPQAGGVYAESGDPTFSSSPVTFFGTYSYYDKEGNSEGASACEWFMSDDENGTNAVSMGTGATLSFDFTSADNGKYMYMEVTPKALTGNLTGDPVQSNFVKIINYPPQAEEVNAEVSDPTFHTTNVTFLGTYSYYDKEGNSEGASVCKWFMSDDESGTNSVLMGTGNTLNYVYDEANDSKYMYMEVTPKALTGNLTGDTVRSSYISLAYNDPPEVRNLTIEGSVSRNSTLTASFTYYDEEGDEQGDVAYQWYYSNNGTNMNAISGATSKTFTIPYNSTVYLAVGVTPYAKEGYLGPGETVTVLTSGVIADHVPVITNASITGVTAIDQQLTLAYDFYDEENDTIGYVKATLYRCKDQSQSDCTYIGERWCYYPNDVTYTVVEADMGYYINALFYIHETSNTVYGTFSLDGGSSKKPYNAYTSTPVSSNYPPQATNLRLDGTVGCGKTVKILYDYSDNEGDLESGTTFQWWRATSSTGSNKTAISGAASQSYTVTSSDIGYYLGASVCPGAATNTTPGSSAFYFYTDKVTNNGPVASNVAIAGTLEFGSTLTSSYTYTDTEGDPESGTTFQWYRSSRSDNYNSLSAISGATSQSYTVTNADSFYFLVIAVTPGAAEGTTPGGTVYKWTSDKITNYVPVASGASIVGSLTRGSTLTASYTYSDFEGDLESGTTFQWYSGGTAISGATSKTYTITQSDIGNEIEVRITPKAETGSLVGLTVRAESNTTVKDAAPVASSLYITGDLKVGSTVALKYTYTDAEGDPESGTTFQWYRDGTAISGATSKTYTLTASDRGYALSVKVTPQAATGTITGSTVTLDCGTVSPNCPSSITMTHTTSGGVAPINATITYGVATYSYKCWITRNLGATAQATALTDNTVAAAGWYWQFNKKQGYYHDGTSRTPSTTWISSITESSDWTSANDPCTLLLGSAWHIPTKSEWTGVSTSTAYSSVLKLHYAGGLYYMDWGTYFVGGNVYSRGVDGEYWSSNQSSNDQGHFFSLSTGFNYSNKASGLSVRCVGIGE